MFQNKGNLQDNSHTLIGRAFAFIRTVRTVLGAIATPTVGNATVLRFASGDKKKYVRKYIF